MLFGDICFVLIVSLYMLHNGNLYFMDLDKSYLRKLCSIDCIGEKKKKKKVHLEFISLLRNIGCLCWVYEWWSFWCIFCAISRIYYCYLSFYQIPNNCPVELHLLPSPWLVFWGDGQRWYLNSYFEIMSLNV